MRRLCLLMAPALLLAAPRAFAQAPVIETVENTASNLTLASIAPEMLITIRGQNLATSRASASGYPLPTTLGGAEVVFYGSGYTLLASLYYASPTQINGVVPNGIQGTSIVVSTKAGFSAPYNVPLIAANAPYAIGQLGIFSQDTSGCGQAVAYNVHQDGSISLNTPQNSLDPEKDAGLTIYLTGLGAANFDDLQDGVPWTYNPTDNLAPQVVSSVTFGAPEWTATASKLTLSYLGPAPGKVGIDQANALGGWKGWPQGCKVPLSLTLFQPLVDDNIAYPPVSLPAVVGPLSYSQLVDVSIHPGGGACADPSDSTLGLITWQKSTVSDAGGTSSTEAVSAQFIQSEGLGFPQPPTGPPFPSPVFPPNPNGAVYGSFVAPPPACSASLPNTLNAGALALSGPGIHAIALEPSNQDGRLTYQAALTPGTLQGGSYQVTGAGGGQVGPFTANANIPAPIANISTLDANFETSNLQPGTKLETPCEIINPHPIFPCGQAYTFTWTGGDDRSIITVQLIVGNFFRAAASAYAGAGTLSIYEGYAPYPGLCGPVLLNEGCTLMPEGDVEVIVTQTPYHAPSQPFSAPGLGWGGESTWKYVWDFRGLTN